MMGLFAAVDVGQSPLAGSEAAQTLGGAPGLSGDPGKRLHLGALWARRSTTGAESTAPPSVLRVSEKAYLCGCGREGCPEALASGTAIARRAGEAGWVAPDGVALSALSVAGAAQEGDRTVSELLREAAKYLATTMVSRVYSYDPAIVPIGGGVPQSDLFMELVREAADAEQIMPAFRAVAHQCDGRTQGSVASSTGPWPSLEGHREIG